MKFLFIVQGEGRGHLTQAITLEEILRRNGHEVPENMDAYLEQPIIIVEKEEVETIYELPNAVVMMPANYLEELGKVEAEVVGPYAIIRSDELQQNNK